MKSRCNEEWCWINQSFVDINDRQMLKKLFRPKKPAKWNVNPREWLNSLDIENVMKQYEEKHQDFIFIGPVPTLILTTNLVLEIALQMNCVKN